jgi:GTPase SAR1 family protein
MGFMRQTLEYQGFDFYAWDVNPDSIRALFPDYFPGTQGVIFVVDSDDRGRIDDAMNCTAFLPTPTRKANLET